MLTTPPFRADHVGSLLRPPSLLQARQDAAGRISAEDLRAAEDDAIRDVVRMQEEVGLQSATDGELRRGSWHMDFIYQLGGITRADEQLVVQFQNAEGTIEFTPAALRVNAKVGLDQPIFADAFRFLAGTVTTATPKRTSSAGTPWRRPRSSWRPRQAARQSRRRRSPAPCRTWPHSRRLRRSARSSRRRRLTPRRRRLGSL